MAKVFLARDLRHDRRVALKVLSPELAAVVGRDRFFAEIKVTAGLQHPHLLPLFDSGEADGQLYYVMPFMEGETLRQRLTRETMLPVDEALRITTAVAGALEYAHRHGVVHRDLKPDNILLHEGEPMVADFGIALAVSNAGGDRLTQTGMSLGTPQYMSPEQATGDRQIDARTDVYSLAAVLYEMLTGDPPHVGNNSQAVIAKLITERPRGIRETREAVPPEVEAAVMRALAKLPADRFATAAEFSAAIKARGISSGTAPVEVAPAVRPRVAAAQVMGVARQWGLPAAVLIAAALVGSLAMRSTQVRQPVQPIRFDIHWSEGTAPSPVEGNLALSRDGTRLVRTPLSVPGLFVRAMDGLTWSRIPGTDSLQATAPTFSPRGDFVLYSTRRQIGSGSLDYLLMRIPVDGGESVQLADSVESDGYSWGDRDQVAFLRRGTLWTVSALGGTPALLAEPDSTRNQQQFKTASFLPGGDAILVSISRGKGPVTAARPVLDSSYLGVVRVKDGSVTEFGIQGVGAKYSLGHLLYTDHSGTVIALPFDAKRLRITGGPTRLAEGALVGPMANDLVVSDNGWMMYVPGDATGGFTRPDLGLERVTRGGTVSSLNLQAQYYESMSVSPDGERIALCVGATSGQSADVWILQVASGHLSPLTRNGQSCWPAWSHDGRRVVYKGADQTGYFTEAPWYSVPWDLSAEPEPVPGAEAAIEYEPGAPGGWFAMSRTDSTEAAAAGPSLLRGDIWIAPVDTPQARRPLSATAGGEWTPSLSPDGKWLAFMVYEPASGGTGRAGAPRIYVRPVPGPGALIPISTGVGLNPVWGKDASTLYFWSSTTSHSVARLALGRDNPVLGIEPAFRGGGSSGGRGNARLLPNGDLVRLVRLPAASGRGAGPAPTPPQPNPIAIYGWLDLVKGSASAPPPPGK
jgi:serine/threonine-protein kinase